LDNSERKLDLLTFSDSRPKNFFETKINNHPCCVKKKITTTQIFFVKTKIFWVCAFVFQIYKNNLQLYKKYFNICKKIFNNCKIFSTTAKKY